MSLGEHLTELRKRFMWAALGLFLGAVVGWLVYDVVFEALLGPIQALDTDKAQLNFTQVMGALDNRVQVSLFVGVFVSSPWWLYQLWAFVAPGLTRRERRGTVGFLAIATPLFFAGAWLAWTVLPNAVRILVGTTPDGALNFIDAAGYLSFVMQFVLIFGVAFLLPLVMTAMTAVGVVRGSTWRKGWRWAIVGISVFSAFATPSPDAISMIVMAVPICGLYGAALLVCAWLDRRRDRRDAAAEAAEAAGSASA